MLNITSEKLISGEISKQIIYKLLNNENYRTIVQTMIDEKFLEETIDFFKKIVNAKLENENLSIDWYKEELSNKELTKKEIAYNSGSNIKTITNTYDSCTKEIVINASLEHYEELYNSIDKLIKDGDEINIELTIKFNGVSVDLNINESLIIINSLAVRRAALRGGPWSKIGKNVDKPLMITLCKIFKVPEKYYSKVGPESIREIDFYLHDKFEAPHKCEVKLMGKGNPESADAFFARESDVFVADALSDLNKKQLTDYNVYWVELRADKGYKEFEYILDQYQIPHDKHPKDLNTEIEKIFKELF